MHTMATIEANQNQSTIPSSWPELVRDSQVAWKGLKRSRILRPRQLPILSGLLDSSMKATFAEYIPEDSPPLLFAWSPLIDEPQDAPKYNTELRYPDDLPITDRNRYAGGITQLNELFTDYATVHFITRNSTKHPINYLTGFYAKGFETMNYGHAIASMVMREVIKKSVASDTDFQNAALAGHFQHDFTLLNEIICASQEVGAKDITGLAVQIGKTLEISNNAESDSIESFPPVPLWKRQLGRGIRTLLFAGLHGQQPGIVEIFATSPLIFSLLGYTSASIFHAGEFPRDAIFGTIVTLIAFAQEPFTIIHEAVHGYGASDNFRGIEPVTTQLNSDYKVN